MNFFAYGTFAAIYLLAGCQSSDRADKLLVISADNSKLAITNPPVAIDNRYRLTQPHENWYGETVHFEGGNILYMHLRFKSGWYGTSSDVAVLKYYRKFIKKKAVDGLSASLPDVKRSYSGLGEFSYISKSNGETACYAFNVYFGVKYPSEGKGSSVGDRYLRGRKCVPGISAVDLSAEMNKLVNSITEK
ncbi:MAG: hypothetical protein HOO19_08575 [Rhodospirillaceae bacterium]|nr:hypothetical protein [Rhodospirillaceae bacterium]MBT6858061.1 hypothetical protein [Rhodospirillaceae bacterium]